MSLIRRGEIIILAVSPVRTVKMQKEIKKKLSTSTPWDLFKEQTRLTTIDYTLSVIDLGISGKKCVGNDGFQNDIRSQFLLDPMHIIVWVLKISNF